MERCGIIKTELKDCDGCIKPEGHNDFHVFRKNGKLIAWEHDYNCFCGCWEENEDACSIYWEVDENFNNVR